MNKKLMILMTIFFSFLFVYSLIHIIFWFKDNKHGNGKQFYKDGTIQSDIDFVNDKYEGYGRYNY